MKQNPRSWEIMRDIVNKKEEKSEPTEISEEEVGELLEEVVRNPNSKFRKQLLEDLEKLEKKK